MAASALPPLRAPGGGAASADAVLAASGRGASDSSPEVGPSQRQAPPLAPPGTPRWSRGAHAGDAGFGGVDGEPSGSAGEGAAGPAAAGVPASSKPGALLKEPVVVSGWSVMVTARRSAGSLGAGPCVTFSALLRGMGRRVSVTASEASLLRHAREARAAAAEATPRAESNATSESVGLLQACHDALGSLVIMERDEAAAAGDCEHTDVGEPLLGTSGFRGDDGSRVGLRLGFTRSSGILCDGKAEWTSVAKRPADRDRADRLPLRGIPEGEALGDSDHESDSDSDSDGCESAGRTTGYGGLGEGDVGDHLGDVDADAARGAALAGDNGTCARGLGSAAASGAGSAAVSCVVAEPLAAEPPGTPGSSVRNFANPMLRAGRGRRGAPDATSASLPARQQLLGLARGGAMPAAATRPAAVSAAAASGGSARSARGGGTTAMSVRQLAAFRGRAVLGKGAGRAGRGRAAAAAAERTAREARTARAARVARAAEAARATAAAAASAASAASVSGRAWPLHTGDSGPGAHGGAREPGAGRLGGGRLARAGPDDVESDSKTPECGAGADAWLTWFGGTAAEARASAAQMSPRVRQELSSVLDEFRG